MKIFDSEFTDRGTLRKVIYKVNYDPNHRQARVVARMDIAKEKQKQIPTEQIIPYREPRYRHDSMSTYLERWKLLQPKENFHNWLAKYKNQRSYSQSI